MREYILCAANHYNDGKYNANQPVMLGKGYVICGRRHYNCSATFDIIVGFPHNEKAKRINKTLIQGFVTNTDRFVNRQKAYTIAFKANQIIGPNKGYPTNEIGLTSEDLY